MYNLNDVYLLSEGFCKIRSQDSSFLASLTTRNLVRFVRKLATMLFGFLQPLRWPFLRDSLHPRPILIACTNKRRIKLKCEHIVMSINESGLELKVKPSA